MRTTELIDENNVLFDKQTLRKYNNPGMNNNDNSLIRRSLSFNNIHRKCSRLLNLTSPHLLRRGQQEKEGVSLMSTCQPKTGGNRLKKRFSGPDISMERRKSLKGMTRFVLDALPVSFFFISFFIYDLLGELRNSAVYFFYMFVT